MWHNTYSTTGTWNVRSMNEGKLETIKQVMENINIAVLGGSEPNWTGMGHFQLNNWKVFYSANDILRRNWMVLTLRQDAAQVIRSFNEKSDWIISIRPLVKPISITALLQMMKKMKLNISCMHPRRNWSYLWRRYAYNHWWSAGNKHTKCWKKIWFRGQKWSRRMIHRLLQRQ